MHSGVKVGTWRVRLPDAPRGPLQAVSGTPMSRGLDDLFGLMVFLRAAPWDSRSVWNRAIQHPFHAGDSAGAVAVTARTDRPARCPWVATSAHTARRLGWQWNWWPSEKVHRWLML